MYTILESNEDWVEDWVFSCLTSEFLCFDTRSDN